MRDTHHPAVVITINANKFLDGLDGIEAGIR